MNQPLPSSIVSELRGATQEIRDACDKMEIRDICYKQYEACLKDLDTFVSGYAIARCTSLYGRRLVFVVCKFVDGAWVGIGTDGMFPHALNIIKADKAKEA